MALQASKGFTEIVPTCIVAVAYLISFFFLSLTLGKIPVAIAYSIWSGVGISLIATVGYFWFGQPLNWYSFAGIVFNHHRHYIHYAIRQCPSAWGVETAGQSFVLYDYSLM